MNCHKKNISRIKIFFVSTVFLFSFSSIAKADYTSISLSPSIGTIYSNETPITVLINSGIDEFIGVDAYLSFTGPVEYVRATKSSRCSSFEVTQGNGSINIECFSFHHQEGESYNSILATLFFRSTGIGTSVFTFTSTDPNTTTREGGTYILSLDSSSVSTSPQSNVNNEIQTSTAGDLPDAGIFDDSRSVLILGFLIMFLGIFFNQIVTKTSLLFNTFSKKLEDRTIWKRRKRLEKDF